MNGMVNPFRFVFCDAKLLVILGVSRMNKEMEKRRRNTLIQNRSLGQRKKVRQVCQNFKRNKSLQFIVHNSF